MPQRILKTVHKTRYMGTLALLFSCAQSQAGDILVTVEGIQANGPLYAALIAAAESDWPQQPLLLERTDNITLRFADVPAGSYAVQVFQDLNGNAELDQSRRGLPLEPVGFSSNPALFSGKPSPGKTRFQHGSADTQLTIRLHSPRARD